MELLNQTVAPALLKVGTATGSRAGRTVLVVAKLTFSTRNGRLELDSDAPVPVFEQDVEAPLGVWPSDVAPAYPTGFEVLLQAAAYAPASSTSAWVELEVGPHRRRLLVSGDRSWVRVGDAWHLGHAEPFVRMPLTWERAFGGTCAVWMDEHTLVPLREPRNPRGRGLDPTADAAALGDLWGAPAGFPRYEADPRLPNLEHPDRPVAARGDRPSPWCWAPLPNDSTLRGEIAAQEAQARGELADESPLPLSAKNIFWRSLPELRFDGVPFRIPVVLRGARPDLEEWSFTVPDLDVHVDFQMGNQRFSKPLHARRLLLLAEEERFAITFARRFAFHAGPPDEERSARVRIEERGSAVR